MRGLAPPPSAALPAEPPGVFAVGPAGAAHPVQPIIPALATAATNAILNVLTERLLAIFDETHYQ
jgi:hypothetical protein